MPSSAQQSPARHRGSWPAIVWIVVVEILVLLALSAAVVGYVNWSSEAAWAEFKAAGKLAAPESDNPIPDGQTPSALRSESVSGANRRRPRDPRARHGLIRLRYCETV